MDFQNGLGKLRANNTAIALIVANFSKKIILRTIEIHTD